MRRDDKGMSNKLRVLKIRIHKFTKSWVKSYPGAGGLIGACRSLKNYIERDTYKVNSIMGQLEMRKDSDLQKSENFSSQTCRLFNILSSPWLSITNKP